ncbi:MAG: dipeptidase, partial [Bacteroidales bacterium]
IQEVQDELENGFIMASEGIDQAAAKMYKENPEQARAFLTNYSQTQGQNVLRAYQNLYKHLFVKFLDGNIKTPREVPEGYKYINPNIEYPGYTEEWYKMIIKETGDKFKVPEEE